MTYLALLLFIGFMVQFAVRKEAPHDFGLIDDEKPVKHGKRWRYRALHITSAALACVVLKSAGSVLVLPWPALFDLLGFLLMGWGLWSLFRLKLNKLRKKDWRYINPETNVYDAVFYAITWSWRMFWVLALRRNVSITASLEHYYIAGTLAYITETLAFLAGVIIALR